MVRNSQNKKDIPKDVFFVLVKNREWIRKGVKKTLRGSVFSPWIYCAGLSSEAAKGVAECCALMNVTLLHQKTTGFDLSFFYPLRKQWHIITRSVYIIKGGIAAFVSHHTFRCVSIILSQ